VSTPPLFDDSLAAAFTRLDDDQARELLRQGWRLDATALRRLETERDDTFVVDTSQGRHVLKVAHPLDDPDVLDVQCAVLEHAIAADPTLPLPRVRHDVDGALLRRVDLGEPRIARLLSYLDGEILDYVRTDAAQRRAIGAAAARLSLALADFEHPAADRSLPWDLKQVGTLRPVLHHVADADARMHAERVLDRFDAHTGAALAQTRQQVVHHDLNPDNLVVDHDDPAFVTGVLDFGDMVHSSVAADLAVVMCYAAGAHGFSDDRDPWAEPYDIADGYLAVRSLHEDEISLLPDLVRARLAQRQIVNSWLAATDPANAHYTGRSLERSARALRALVDTPAPIERG
jgi:Ser/Thr protein kinase RdoA (MazF antagonist)